MTLDRTKTYTAAGGKWLWHNGLSLWLDESAQWLNEDTFILLNPVPVVEMETITKTITATFDENGSCVAGSATGNFVRCVLSDGDRNRYDEVINATAVITVELTRPLADLDRYDEEAHAEYMANLALESEVTE